jgi:hypothetical protein
MSVKAGQAQAAGHGQAGEWIFAKQDTSFGRGCAERQPVNRAERPAARKPGVRSAKLNPVAAVSLKCLIIGRMKREPVGLALALAISLDAPLALTVALAELGAHLVSSQSW